MGVLFSKKIFPKDILGQFWRGMYRKYLVNMTKLDLKNVEYIINEKLKESISARIAGALKISKRRVDQIYHSYIESSR